MPPLDSSATPDRELSELHNTTVESADEPAPTARAPPVSSLLAPVSPSAFSMQRPRTAALARRRGCSLDEEQGILDKRFFKSRISSCFTWIWEEALMDFVNAVGCLPSGELVLNHFQSPADRCPSRPTRPPAALPGEPHKFPTPSTPWQWALFVVARATAPRCCLPRRGPARAAESWTRSSADVLLVQGLRSHSPWAPWLGPLPSLTASPLSTSPRRGAIAYLTAMFGFSLFDL